MDSHLVAVPRLLLAAVACPVGKPCIAPAGRRKTEVRARMHGWTERDHLSDRIWSLDRCLHWTNEIISSVNKAKPACSIRAGVYIAADHLVLVTSARGGWKKEASNARARPRGRPSTCPLSLSDREPSIALESWRASGDRSVSSGRGAAAGRMWDGGVRVG